MSAPLDPKPWVYQDGERWAHPSETDDEMPKFLPRDEFEQDPTMYALMSRWFLDGTRKWYCKVCGRFTDWEFRRTGPDAEDERCTACAPAFDPWHSDLPGYRQDQVDEAFEDGAWL